MDLRHLRTFVAVAEAGSVSKAALRLHIAQPALSRQVRALEEELGVELFQRVSGRLQLSPAGERLLGESRGLLNYARELNEHAQLLKRPDAGVLRVAASPHFLEAVFPEFLRRYAKRFPDVQVKMVDIMGVAAIAMLERGEIHLAQSAERLLTPIHAHIESLPLVSVEMLAAFNPDLGIAKGDAVDIAQLAPFPLLQGGMEYVMRQKFDAACRLAGFEPNNALESRAPHPLLAMAEAGHGVAIIPSAVRTLGYRLSIAKVIFRKEAIVQALHILFDRRRHQPLYMTSFCQMLVQYVHDTFPITRPAAYRGRRARYR
jgi:LysR family nitrogen assimilation transcriptional regulator